MRKVIMLRRVCSLLIVCCMAYYSWKHWAVITTKDPLLLILIVQWVAVIVGIAFSEGVVETK